MLRILSRALIKLFDKKKGFFGIKWRGIGNSFSLPFCWFSSETSTTRCIRADR